MHNRYILFFPVTGIFKLLEQDTFTAAYRFVEQTYGVDWRSMCEIWGAQRIAG